MTLMRGLKFRQRHLVGLLFACFLLGMLLGIRLIASTQDSKPAHREHTPLIKDNAEFIIKGKEDEQHEPIDEPNDVNYNAHVFYYPWYGNPEFDGQYYHWNHPFLQHWDKKEAERWPKGRHVPPDDVGASFFPALGPYSSTDPAVIRQHMQQIRKAGIGTLSVSWYPPGMSDDNGKKKMADSLISTLLDHAHQHGLKVCLHIEPYSGRSHFTLRENLHYIHKTYASHPAFYKYEQNGKLLPLYYIYDSYQTPVSDWATIFQPSGEHSIRGSEIDGVFIGLIVEAKHKIELLAQAGFDGYYTYFASTGFSYGSNSYNWHSLQKYATSLNSLFIPSVGPGYDDERIRPWNARNTKLRGNGEYYDRMFQSAIAVRPPIISITSFNEWGEGTQIEEAVPKSFGSFKYRDYEPHTADHYLLLTKSKLVDYSNKLQKLDSQN